MERIKLSPFPNVPTTGLAQLSTNELEGKSVHGIVFELGGTTFTKAMIDRVRITRDGKNFINDITGAQLQDANEYDGLATSTNYLIWWFGDPTARTIRGQHLGDLDLSIYRGKPLELELKITGATAPTLVAWAITSVPKLDMGIGFSQADALACRAFIPSTLTPPGAQSRKAEAIGLGSGAGSRIRKIYNFHGSANLLSVEFSKGGLVKHQDLSIALNTAIQLDFGRVPQSNVYVVDFIADGNSGEAEDTVTPDGKTWPIQMLYTTSGAGNIIVAADVLTVPALI